MAEQDESIIQFYRNAMQIKASTQHPKRTIKPNRMTKVMTMFNGHGRGAEPVQPDTAYGLLCNHRIL
jgi:hypothetical protein